jgi:hypothetical protein
LLKLVLLKTLDNAEELVKEATGFVVELSPPPPPPPPSPPPIK